MVIEQQDKYKKKITQLFHTSIFLSIAIFFFNLLMERMPHLKKIKTYCWYVPS